MKLKRMIFIRRQHDREENWIATWQDSPWSSRTRDDPYRARFACTTVRERSRTSHALLDDGRQRIKRRWGGNTKVTCSGPRAPWRAVTRRCRLANGRSACRAWAVGAGGGGCHGHGKSHADACDAWRWRRRRGGMPGGMDMQAVCKR